MNTEKTMIILRGLPGSGKSTFAEYLSFHNNSVICSSDDFFYDEEGNYNFDYNKIEKSHQYCYDKCKNALENNKNVIIDNTNVKEEHFNKYIKLAKQYNYKYFSIIVENRESFKNIHGVTNEIIEEFRNNFSIKL